MIMKRLFAGLLVLVAINFGCATLGMSQAPTPPITLPFDVHQAGATVETDLRIVDKTLRPYYFELTFWHERTYYQDEIHGRADQARVRELVGGYYSDPGIRTPVKLKIIVYDSSGERTFLEKEYIAEGNYGHGVDNLKRLIDYIRLPPGMYHITIQSLKDIPELVGTKVTFGIHNPR
jgi:hypothetical protein